MTARKVANSALNTIMMVAFAFPAAKPLGILAAIALFFGNLIPFKLAITIMALAFGVLMLFQL